MAPVLEGTAKTDTFQAFRLLPASASLRRRLEVRHPPVSVLRHHLVVQTYDRDLRWRAQLEARLDHSTEVLGTELVVQAGFPVAPVLDPTELIQYHKTITQIEKNTNFN
uniref:(northern house mosquito) hypothetical protein n=1 Tax=Culex pipiens TaxID=7175 RepID=A0A8D8N8S7_CULPI